MDLSRSPPRQRSMCRRSRGDEPVGSGKRSDIPKIERVLISASSKKASQFIYGAASPASEFPFRLCCLKASLVACVHRSGSVVLSMQHIGACCTCGRLSPRRAPKPHGARIRPSIAQAQSGRELGHDWVGQRSARGEETSEMCFGSGTEDGCEASFASSRKIVRASFV